MPAANYPARADALNQAVLLLRQAPDDWSSLERHAKKVLEVADIFYDWLTTVGELRITPAPFTYTIGTGDSHPTVITPGGSVQLKDNQQVVLTVEALDSLGNPTTDTNLTWSVSDTTIANLSPSADGLSCTVAATGKLGLGAVVTASDGVRSGTESVDVIAGDVASLTIVAGTPTDIPPAS